MDTLIDEFGQITILYQVVSGIADRSFGINIAKIVGFSSEIIEVN